MAKLRSTLTLFCVLVFALTVGLIIFYQAKQHDETTRNYWDKQNDGDSRTIDHDIWQSVLDSHLVTDHPSKVNRVDYENLTDNAEALEKYIQLMSSIDPRDYNKHQQMAYWINLYNALTVRLIAENYPLDSITELGESPLAFGPWDDKLVTVAGKHLTLNDIEHQILRPIWQDHRIHFAVNCASVGCPNLQATVFTGENLEALLEHTSLEYLRHERALRFNKKDLVLSSIFDWYKKDFGKNTQEMLEKLSQYLPANRRTEVANFNGKIHYEYDWSLNDI